MRSMKSAASARETWVTEPALPRRDKVAVYAAITAVFGRMGCERLAPVKEV